MEVQKLDRDQYICVIEQVLNARRNFSFNRSMRGSEDSEEEPGDQHAANANAQLQQDRMMAFAVTDPTQPQFMIDLMVLPLNDDNMKKLTKHVI
jgi:hypothetical protein